MIDSVNVVDHDDFVIEQHKLRKFDNTSHLFLIQCDCEHANLSIIIQGNF